MKTRTLAAALLLALSFSAFAVPADGARDLEQKANANAAKITSAEKLISDLENSVDMAHEGVYGRISKKDMRRVDEARDTIISLLQGRDHARQLNGEERLKLYNAQLLVTSIIRDDDKNRKICMRVNSTGSRLMKAECLTVAEREQRAVQAKENVREMQRPSAIDCPPVC